MNIWIKFGGNKYFIRFMNGSQFIDDLFINLWYNISVKSKQKDLTILLYLEWIVWKNLLYINIQIYIVG